MGSVRMLVIIGRASVHFWLVRQSSKAMGHEKVCINYKNVRFKQNFSFSFLFFRYFSPKAPLYDLLGHEDKVHDCDWSNPKYMVSGGSDNSVRVFKSKKAFAKGT